ncbi:MAG: hypothetical protein M1830_007828, partial [Pleopsidium flavum]
MSSEKLGLDGPESRKRRASIAFSQSPTPPRPSKLLNAGPSAEMDTACPSSPSSESEELGPDDLESEELGSNEPGSDEFESDERDFDMNFEEPESDWPESEEAESGVPEQRDSHPIEK